MSIWPESRKVVSGDSRKPKRIGLINFRSSEVCAESFAPRGAKVTRGVCDCNHSLECQVGMADVDDVRRDVAEPALLKVREKARLFH
jgi:hypothetical protein